MKLFKGQLVYHSKNPTFFNKKQLEVEKNISETSSRCDGQVASCCQVEVALRQKDLAHLQDQNFLRSSAVLLFGVRPFCCLYKHCKLRFGGCAKFIFFFDFVNVLFNILQLGLGMCFFWPPRRFEKWPPRCISLSCCRCDIEMPFSQSKKSGNRWRSCGSTCWRPYPFSFRKPREDLYHLTYVEILILYIHILYCIMINDWSIIEIDPQLKSLSDQGCLDLSRCRAKRHKSSKLLGFQLHHTSIPFISIHHSTIERCLHPKFWASRMKFQNRQTCAIKHISQKSDKNGV